VESRGRYARVVDEVRRRFDARDGDEAYWEGHVKVNRSVLKELRENRRSEPGVSGEDMEKCRAIVFDWDDTMFPTSALSCARGDCDDGHDSVKSVHAQLEHLDMAAVQVLLVARELGRVIIVTNSSTGWVQESSAKFLPLLHRHIIDENVEVVSARDLFSSMHPDCPSEWKAYAMAEVLGNLAADDINVLALGDCYSDQYAAHQAERMLMRKNSVNMKCVKLLTRPSIQRLTKELLLLKLSLERMALCRSPFDIGINLT